MAKAPMSGSPRPNVPKDSRDDNAAQKRGASGGKAASTTYRGTTQGNGSSGRYD